MSTFKFGIGTVSSALDSLKLTSQPLASNVIVLDPVYFDGNSNKWEKAINIRPRGVVESLAGDIILSGKLTTSGLTADIFYFLDTDVGNISVKESSVKIGKAISTTELLIDIDVVGLLMTDIAGYRQESTSFEKVLFINDDIASVTSTLPSIDSASGFSSNLSGYITGGRASPPAIKSLISKLLFSDESASTISSVLGLAREQSSSFNSKTFGYNLSGRPILTPGVLTSVVEKIAFSNDVVLNLSGLVVARQKLQEAGYSSSTSGYVIGGDTSLDSTPLHVSNIDILDFSNDSNSTSGTVLSAKISEGTGFNSQISGYYVSGRILIPTSNIEKLIFSSNSNAVIATSLSPTTKQFAPGFNSNSAGYSSGGFVSVTTNKLIFSIDTNSNIVSLLSVGSFGTGFEHISF